MDKHFKREREGRKDGRERQGRRMRGWEGRGKEEKGGDGRKEDFQAFPQFHICRYITGGDPMSGYGICTWVRQLGNKGPSKLHSASNLTESGNG